MEKKESDSNDACVGSGRRNYASTYVSSCGRSQHRNKHETLV